MLLFVNPCDLICLKIFIFAVVIVDLSDTSTQCIKLRSKQTTFVSNNNKKKHYKEGNFYPAKLQVRHDSLFFWMLRKTSENSSLHSWRRMPTQWFLHWIQRRWLKKTKQTKQICFSLEFTLINFKTRPNNLNFVDDYFFSASHYTKLCVKNPISPQRTFDELLLKRSQSG